MGSKGAVVPPILPMHPRPASVLSTLPRECLSPSSLPEISGTSHGVFVTHGIYLGLRFEDLLCGLPSSRNFTDKSLENRKSFRPSGELCAVCLLAWAVADHRASSCLVGTTAAQTPGAEVGELGPPFQRSLSWQASPWKEVRNSC